MGDDGAEAAPAQRIPDVPQWSEAERLAFEKDSLGFFVSGHPLEQFREELEQWATATTGGLRAMAEASDVAVGGLLTALRLIKTKKGDRMATFVLEDLEGTVEALVFPRTYAEIAGRLSDDAVVLVKGRGEQLDDGKARLIVADVQPLEKAKLAEARFVTIRVPIARWDRERGERLREILSEHRGECRVTLDVIDPGSFSVAVAPSAYYRVRPDSQFKEKIEQLFGPDALVLARNADARAS
jgi:DNA polymerase-3 subunit alpha